MRNPHQRAIMDKQTIGAFLSVLGASVTFISLVSDVGQLSQSTWGKAVVIGVFVVTIAYLSWFIYSHLLIEKQRINDKLDKIQQLIENFITDPTHTSINENLDHDLVYRTVATKQILTNPVPIQEVQFKQNGTNTIVEITVGCGYNHGLRDGMLFGVFHRDQMKLVTSCTCTVGYEQSKFSFPIPENCGVSIHEITKQRMEIKPIIPDGVTLINKFLSELLFELDDK